MIIDSTDRFVSDLTLYALSGKYPKYAEFYKAFWKRDHDQCGFHAPIGTPGYFERMNGPCGATHRSKPPHT